MDFIAVLIPLLPLLAAAIIGLGHLFNQINGEAGERTTSGIANIAISLSCLLALGLLVFDLLNENAGTYIVGKWLGSDSLTIELSFITTGFSVIAAALFSVLLVIITRFSINYIHKEAGFHRFFFILSLFSSAMLMLVLSNNIVGTFIGWEIAGLCSYFLISFAYDRPVAVINATRVFVTNRMGDAGFILGIGLTFYYTGTVDWTDLNAISDQLATPTATVIALCFIIAAFAKSVQLPFTPWLARAMEGPTPSSALFYGSVMVHAGVFLVILLQPIIERAPFAMGLLVFVGLSTAIYSFIVGLTQTDVKSSICFAISGQLGLMFLACGLGFWEFAIWHLCAHAVVRGYQVLTAPSLLHYVHGNPMKPVARDLAQLRWMYIASLQRFWLDPITDRMLVRPVIGLGRDLDHFDSHFIDRAIGSPTSTSDAISSLAQLEQRIMIEHSGYDASKFGRGKGIAGKIFEWTASAMSWFEERLVLRGIGIEMVDIGKQLGYAANTFEKLLLKPRYLVLFVFVVLLSASSI
jgi:NADH:ubiquinone oxidoreductase subunit 5 (subunit L)/multisubunit Na+/H+ antiporter MnhA subunit